MTRSKWLGWTLVLCAVAAPAARGQDWLLDDAVRAFSAEAKDELRKGISRAPERALESILKDETKHLEALAEDDLIPLAKEAWARVRDARDDGHLVRAVRAELTRARAPLGAFLARVVAEERRRLATFDERLVYHLVDQALRRTLVERLTRLRDARFTIGRADAWTSGPAGSVPDPDTLRNGTTTDWLMANRVMTNGVPRFSWREHDHDADFDLSTDLPLPRFTLFHDEARMREVLFEREYRSDLGDLKVVAASVDGLASARAGRVTMPDAFGREVEGLGATFTAHARLTGVKADVRSRDLDLHANDFGFRTHLSATVLDVGTHVAATGTALVTEHGAGVRADVRAGAGASAAGRLPIEIDLRVVTLRVIPYASVHAGAMAEAHASFEVSWSGTIRFDVGAAASAGIGVGGGVVIELELGPVLKAAIDKAMRKLARLVRPVGDALLGRTWKGPPVDSGRVTLTLADLEAAWATSGEAEPARHTDTPEQVAARFAPVLYQRVHDEHDFLRRVDFDGDWDMTNNWEHADGGDRTSWVYYDVKETATHWFVTYTLFHARRVSTAIRPLRGWKEHENDLGGCIVVARKGAPRGREVELLLTTEGERLHGYGPAKDAGRWKRRDGDWNGETRFVDEVSHPLFDLERTHPQVWIDDKTHDVRGFTGRDDGDPFSGNAGVVYVPTGSAGVPDGVRDEHVGYALRPLDELLAHASDGAAFTTDDTVRPRGHDRAYPRRMRGDEGPNDSAIPPWAWHSYLHDEFEEHGSNERTRRDPSRTILEGDLFVDPARVVSILYATPGDFSRVYVRTPAPTAGLAGSLR